MCWGSMVFLGKKAISSVYSEIMDIISEYSLGNMYFCLLFKFFVKTDHHADTQNFTPNRSIKIGAGKAIIIMGPRQAGKSTLLNELAKTTDRKYLFLDCERMKWLQTHRSHTQHYFWRTTEAREIDYLETFDGQINAYEFKWNPERSVSFPKSFLNAYPEAQTQIVHPENYQEFLK